MKFQLTFPPPVLPDPIRYTDKILLIGSCFTEHIAKRLTKHKFQVLHNPNGVLFNPLSVANSLMSYASEKTYGEEELFCLNEIWNSWDFHSCFSHIDKATALEAMNASQMQAVNFIKNADWIFITLGSSFQYVLTDEADEFAKFSNPLPWGEKKRISVANNHRAPANWFDKKLVSSDVVVEAFSDVLRFISGINPKVKYLFTISPVRHLRDGVVDNNRSKARLIEAVHTICDNNASAFYFPAYDWVIDVLRDYRFFDIDLVHPNFAATESVWEIFVQSCISPAVIPVMEEVKDILTARSHLPRFPNTERHKNFMKSYAEKLDRLLAAHPYLNLAEEQSYFNQFH